MQVEWMLNNLLKAKKVTSIRTKHSIACLNPLSPQVIQRLPQRTLKPAQQQQILQPQAQPAEEEAQTWNKG